MKRSFLNLLRIFYANDESSKYAGGSYVMALLMATFYIMVALALLVGIAFCISPDFYKLYLANSGKINGRWVGAGMLVVIFSLLRISVKEADICETTLEPAEVKRFIRILIVSTVIIVCIVLFIFMKVFKHY
jgi:hypothetical protein